MKEPVSSPQLDREMLNEITKNPTAKSYTLKASVRILNVRVDDRTI